MYILSRKETDGHTRTHRHTNLNHAQVKDGKVVDGLETGSGDGEDVRGEGGRGGGVTGRAIMKQHGIEQSQQAWSGG